MQIGFGIAELEYAQEFEPIDERKKVLDCPTSTFLFLLRNDFFFLDKLYGEYRMWQLWWYFTDFLSMARSKSGWSVPFSPTAGLVVIFAGSKGDRPFFQNSTNCPVRFTIPFVVERRSPFSLLSHTQHSSHSISWTSFMASFS